jgi:heme oxygenase
MNLKELTWEHHKNAERQEFAGLMMSGKLNPDLYATYLWNQHKKYDLLEAIAAPMGLFSTLGDIRRKLLIEEDFRELWKNTEEPIITKSTHEYIMHMRDLIGNAEALTAHMYVLYMGDLSGGQMIKKRIPGSGKMYDFDGDVPAIKESIREMCNDSMAEEAKYVFDSATELFKELMELNIEPYMEQTD